MSAPTRAAGDSGEISQDAARDWLPLLRKIRAAYGSDVFRQRDKAPITNAKVLPLIEEAAEAGLLTIDRSEAPMLRAGPRVIVALDGCFVRITSAGRAALAKATTP